MSEHEARMQRLVANLVYATPYVQLYQGDSRHLPLEDGTISCVVTSPPYLGLRKYAGDQDLIWDEPLQGCEHVWGDTIISKANDSNRAAMEWTTGGNPAAKVLGIKVSQGQFCQRCGAWRGAFGLEPSPGLYIRHLMTFMEELWRVMRDDGVCFVNMGDSYYGGKGQSAYGWSSSHLERQTLQKAQDHATGGFGKTRPTDLPIPGLRPKSLMLIPERFALACQEAGWIVRSRIVWAKPNPMPESVQDRPSDAWEHIWMLTKSERYWWGQEAVREPLAASTLADSRNETGRHPYQNSKHDAKDRKDKASWERAKTFVNPEQGRNLRNVWTLATEPYPDAHFAVFPTAIPERCILAACPPAICKACGKPRERIVEKGELVPDAPGYKPRGRSSVSDSLVRVGMVPAGQSQPHPNHHYETTTLGWTDCGHDSWESGLVLDPFSGSGTTVMVAQQLGRRAVGVDLSAMYLEMARKRLEAVPLPMEMSL